MLKSSQVFFIVNKCAVYLIRVHLSFPTNKFFEKIEVKFLKIKLHKQMIKMFIVYYTSSLTR